MKSLSKVIERGNRAAFVKWSNTDPVATSDGVAVGNIAKQEKAKEQFIEGYDEGFKKGEAEGKAAGMKPLQDSAQKLSQVMNALTQPYVQINEQAENEFMTLVLSLTKHIIKKELETSPDTIMSVIREAMSVLSGTIRDVKISINPQDAVIFKENIDASDQNIHYTIIEDKTIGRGGCKVKTETSSVDATIEKQFEAFSSQLLGDDDE